jgi:serine acetyltransferase
MKRISYGKAVHCFIRDVILSIYCYRNIKVYICNHLNIGVWELYKKQTILPHPIGIVIGYKAKIGYGCKIYHNVTIGTKETQNFKEGKYPSIGNNVIIYPNSIIIGDISVGDNVIIGAGSIVLDDIPANSIATGVPAAVVNSKSKHEK